MSRPVPKVGLRTRDGEIEVTGDHVNKSYLDPAQTAENKVIDGDKVWHRTGDAGRLDAQGHLWLLGRVGDEVRGPNGPIHPFAVEVTAQVWPGVTRCDLMKKAGHAVLAIEGERANVQDWRTRAKAFGIDRVEVITAMPMDARHHSKIDRGKLARMLKD